MVVTSKSFRPPSQSPRSKFVDSDLVESQSNERSASWVAPLLSSGEDFDGAVSPRSSALLGALKTEGKKLTELLHRRSDNRNDIR